MKKVLALVLAVMMMATVAFAVTYNDTVSDGSTVGRNANITPGSKIKIVRDSGSAPNAAIFSKNGNAAGVSGEVRYEDAAVKLAKDIDTENYSVKSVKYNEGKSLIKDIYISDKDNELVIQMADDYDNTKDKSFDVEFTLQGKGKYTVPTGLADAGKKKSTPDVDFRIKGTVGYQKLYMLITDNDDDLDAYELYEKDAAPTAVGGANPMKTIAEDKIGDYVIEASAKGGNYGTMTQDISSDEVTVEVRVYDGDKFNLAWNTDVNNDVVKANADLDAELNFYEWEAAPTFSATAKVFFNDADEDHYVYEIKNGKLTAAGKYDEDEGCWVLKTRTLGSYVVSDTKLSSVSVSDVTGNPDTGANDVVGIATALAAVALVSAAAVSLKK